MFKLNKNKVWVLPLLYLCYALLTPNFFLSLLVVSSITFILYFFGKLNPPFILFALLMQWLSLSIDLLYCNFLGITLAEKIYLDGPRSYGIPQFMNHALVLSHYALIFFSLGLLITIKKIYNIDQTIKELKAIYDPLKLIFLYLIILLISIPLSRYQFLFPGLTQFINFFLILKWGFFFVMVTICIEQKKTRILMSTIIFIEFIAGFASFFSSTFSSIFIFTFLALMTRGIKFRTKNIIQVVIISIGVLYSILIWTSIKGEYRYFLTKGLRSQAVTVNKGEALQKFFSLASSTTNQQLLESTTAIINRIGYITFFSASLKHVPEFEPFQNGHLLLEAYTHYLKPRILFPDKEIIDDSAHTRKYTGTHVAGANEGTSISLGYPADSYIDFGPLGMAFPSFVLGITIGLLYRFFQNFHIPPLWKWIVLAPFYFLTNVNQFNTIKIIGPIFIFAVIAPISLKLLVYFLDNKLLNKQNNNNGS